MRRDLKAQLEAARANTDELFSIVRPEAIYDRPIPERHRLIFYLGHVEAFDWNQVCRGALGMPSFHPSFDRLFAFGIDPPEGGATQDSASDWPSVEEVRSYNRRVRSEIDKALGDAPEQIVHVAIEHRWMHAETFAYLLHRLPLDRKTARPADGAASATAEPERTIGIPAGQATLGREAGDGFGWDNEFERHTVKVPAFAIARYKVTNGDYLEFVRDGGDPPPFWSLDGGQWRLRTMFAEAPLPLDWPVYVTWRGAASYARWRGKRLPTEPEFHRAAYGTPSGDERPYPWGDAPPDRPRGNFDFARWDPEPVTARPQGDSAFGVAQLVGNGWEWTATPFEPFPGFQPFPFYPGYSADFFDGSHYVLKGGSPRTAGPLLRRSFRNWFRPNYPHVYAGFRVVEN
jgi:formylglycine-generating enzyme required for sulfatase activity